jgi:hypothetical protein
MHGYSEQAGWPALSNGPAIRVAGSQGCIHLAGGGLATLLMDGDLGAELVSMLVGADVEHPRSGGRGPA